LQPENIASSTEAYKNDTDVHDILKVEEAINALTAADIQKVAKKFLGGDYIVGTLKPKMSN